MTNEYKKAYTDGWQDCFKMIKAIMTEVLSKEDLDKVKKAWENEDGRPSD